MPIPPELVRANDRCYSPASERKNLPKRHFKKQYFSASPQQSSDSFGCGGGRAPDSSSYSQSSTLRKDLPSLLGSSRRLALRLNKKTVRMAMKATGQMFQRP